jgi:quercetin dioxygenase-like cupin family protein
MSQHLMEYARPPVREVQYIDREQVIQTRLARFEDLRFEMTEEHEEDPRCRRFRVPLIADRAVAGDEGAAVQGREGVTIELARFLPGGYITPHLHPTLEFLMVLEGTGELILNNEWDKPITLHHFDAVAIPADVLRSFGNPREDRDCLMWIAVIDTHQNAYVPTDDFVFIR